MPRAIRASLRLPTSDAIARGKVLRGRALDLGREKGSFPPNFGTVRDRLRFSDATRSFHRRLSTPHGSGTDPSKNAPRRRLVPSDDPPAFSEGPTGRTGWEGLDRRGDLGRSEKRDGCGPHPCRMNGVWGESAPIHGPGGTREVDRAPPAWPRSPRRLVAAELSLTDRPSDWSGSSDAPVPPPLAPS
eukprot:scaffold684_cov345-Pavlova_lutheri.AAC.66